MKSKNITPYLAWLLAAGFVFFQLFLQSASTIMSELWVKDFTLNEIELSNLSAAFFYSYIPMQIPAGILYDKFNIRTVLLYSAVTLSLSCIMLGVVHDYKLAIIARFFMGLGASSGFVGLLKIIQNDFPRNQFVLMFGIAEAIGMVGIALGLIVLTPFLNYYSWRSAMILSGFFAGILAIAIYFFVHDKNKNKAITRISFKKIISQLGSIITNKQVIFCSIYGFFIVSIMNCFTSLWGEPFLANTYNFSSQTNSMLLSTVFIGLSIGSPCNGWFVRWYGRHKELMLLEAGFSTLITSIIVLAPNVPLAILYLLFFLIGFLCSGYGPCYALVNDAVDVEIQATAVAVANMFIVSSAPILQLVVGGILESYSFGYAASILENYRIALMILPLGYFISFMAGFFIKPSKFATTEKGELSVM